MPKSKVCQTCGNKYRRGKLHRPQWERSRFCSYACRKFPKRTPRDKLACFNELVMPEPMSGCWLWMGTVGPRHGYGQIGIGGKLLAAHRLSYELHCGSVPVGLHILHKCDNRICVNPHHLYAGTPADNSADAVARKRLCCGPRNSATKLTAEIVREIRASSLTNTALAAKFGVSRPAIANVRARRAWSHV